MPKITQRASFYSHVNPICRQRLPLSLSLISFYGNSEAKFRNLIFFRKRPQTRERIRIVVGVPSVYKLFDRKYYPDLPGGILENFGRLTHREC
jgi:hypothetical protein